MQLMPLPLLPLLLLLLRLPLLLLRQATAAKGLYR